MFNYKHQKGFTLLELLVVMGIISLLSSIVLSSVSQARIKGRNGGRIATFIQLRNAVELYRSDNGFYPKTDVFLGGGVMIHRIFTGSLGSPIPNLYGYFYCPTFHSDRTTSGATGWIPNLAPKYLPVLPGGSSSNDCYEYASDGNDYRMATIGTLEGTECSNYADPKNSSLCDFTFDPNLFTPPTHNMSVYTPGASAWVSDY